MAQERMPIPKVAWQTMFLLVVAAALGALALWILPVALTHGSLGEMTTAERLRAANDVRAAVIAFLVLIGAGGTLWFTSRTYLLNREGHITDRYTKAIGQLGDGSAAVRIGGVFALGRIALDSRTPDIGIA